jgi:hypothetical protein
MGTFSIDVEYLLVATWEDDCKFSIDLASGRDLDLYIMISNNAEHWPNEKKTS